MWRTGAAFAPRTCHDGRMTTWGEFEQAEPEFARRVRELFDAHRHKTIATVRADGLASLDVGDAINVGDAIIR